MQLKWQQQKFIQFFSMINSHKTEFQNSIQFFTSIQPVNNSVFQLSDFNLDLFAKQNFFMHTISIILFYELLNFLLIFHLFQFLIIPIRKSISFLCFLRLNFVSTNKCVSTPLIYFYSKFHHIHHLHLFLIQPAF